MKYSSMCIKNTSSDATRMLREADFPVGPVAYVADSEDSVSCTGN